MTTFEFTLKFRLPDHSVDLDSLLDALAEAGCDDALVGIGQPGRLAMDFEREGRTAFDALASAVRDVKRAIPGIELVEASPDFVGLSDVAEIAGFTRQNMRKLMVANPTTFPLAIHEGTPSLWHLATVLSWLRDHQDRKVDGVLLEVATANMALNIAKEARALPGALLPKSLAPLVA